MVDFPPSDVSFRGGEVFGGMMMGRYIILGGFEICYFATYRYKLGDSTPLTSMRVNHIVRTHLMITPQKFNSKLYS